MPAQDRSDLNIYQIGANPVIAFAAQELHKYMRQMTRSRMTGAEAAVQILPAYHPEEQDGIWVGLISDMDGPPIDLPVSDFDDWIFVDVKRGRGRIAGVNSRSVLLAVYQFLRAAGCRWVRPGAGGELRRAHVRS